MFICCAQANNLALLVWYVAYEDFNFKIIEAFEKYLGFLKY